MHAAMSTSTEPTIALNKVIHLMNVFQRLSLRRAQTSPRGTPGVGALPLKVWASLAASYGRTP